VIDWIEIIEFPNESTAVHETIVSPSENENGASLEMVTEDSARSIAAALPTSIGV
jgi:hypothetical protein